LQISEKDQKQGIDVGKGHGRSGKKEKGKTEDDNRASPNKSVEKSREQKKAREV